MIHAPPTAALTLLDHEIKSHLRVILAVAGVKEVGGNGLLTSAARPLFFLVVGLFVR